jgi:hypothetical protein
MREVQMQKLLNITWRLTCEQEGTVREHHAKSLDASALDTVSAAISLDPSKRGGVLEDNIKTTSDDPEEGVDYTGTWELTDISATRFEYALPYSVNIKIGDGSAAISSDLLAQFEDPDEELDSKAAGAADAMECFLLSMAAEGIDLSTQAMKNAFEEAVQQIGQNL